MPTTVSVKDSNDADYNVPVTWEYDGSTVPTDTMVFNTAGEYLLTAVITGTSESAALTINVTGETTYVITKLELDTYNLSVHPDDTNTIKILSAEPDKVNLKSLIWKSYNTSIAKVSNISEDGSEITITGHSLGWTIINVTNIEGTLLASINVTVSNDESLTDAVYISGVDAKGDALDQFASIDEIYIIAYNLPFVDYNIKIEEKSSSPLLGKGTFEVDNLNTIIVIDQDTLEVTTITLVKLYGENGVLDSFTPSDNFSKSYFVSVSHEYNYPSGDYEEDGIGLESGTPKTLVDNFKITSPVPTGDIEVTVQQIINGSYQIPEPSLYDSGTLLGPDVILGREIKNLSAEETQITDYYTDDYKSLYQEANFSLDDYPDLVKYTDEVKYIGHIIADGSVSWDIPKESLKIGGYILLIELPVEEFTTNLNDEFGDGLLKEIHLVRSDPVDYNPVERTIIIQRIQD